jgi:transcriptional regulator with XRE-family HTH domain
MCTSWKLQRLIAELTQKEAARRARMSVRRLSLIERGEIKIIPGSDEYERLAGAMPWPERNPASTSDSRTSDT